MPKPTIFEFKSTTADLAVGEFSFSYAIHFEDQEALNFTEKIKLPEPSNFGTSVPPTLLKSILRDLHLALGLSYYKLYIPPVFKHGYSLDTAQAEFWNTLYKKGLGEFLYRNQIKPDQIAKFESVSEFAPSSTKHPRKDRALSSIGGGKDSIVSTELLKTTELEVATLYTQTQRINEATKKLIEAFNLPNLTVERTLDPLIFEKQEGSYNGHIPISAIFAFLGTLTAILCDYRYVVVANEHSSNFGNVEWEGMTINHQWSKSGEFEQLFQDYARNYITPDVTYFSLLRHSSELRIAKLFANYPKYFSLFSSCNRVGKISGQGLDVKNAYVPVSDSQLKAKSCKLQALPSPSALWCGTCAKCCFVFLMLSASLKKKDLLAIFGRNLLEDESLVPMFKNLLGFGEMKPFDCVGTFEEARAALSISRKSLPLHPSLSVLLPSYKLQAESYKLSLMTHPAPTLPARFAFLGMKKVAILGYGREGKVTKKYLKQKYPNLKIKVLDERKNKNYLLKQVNFDALVKTPGIQKELVKIYYTTATNLFFAQVPHEQIIGVTGSKGKSTTASLIYAILKASGKDVELLGNIGGPMLGALLYKKTFRSPLNNLTKLLSDKKLFVLELSSYQLDDIQASPHVAVVSNLFPEHMNYHGSLANYYKAKENITHFQTTSDFFIASQKIELAQKWHTQAKRIPTITKLPIIETDIPLLGEHNKDNVRSALTAINLFDIPENVQAQAIRAFKGLPHRLEYIGEFRGVQFYDDAISTSPESTIEALNSLQNIGVLFLGGQDRGYNFTELEIAIKNRGIKNIVLFPESGEKIFTDTTGLNILHTKKMKDAIAFAFANAKPGEVCLLSTASPSYSVWKNFIEKGNEFQKYAKKFGKAKH